MITVKSYNGHLRNGGELCAALGLDAAAPRRERELLILQKGYETWGRALPEHLIGAFAFVLWDTAKQELFCARDHFGAKPFYYAQAAGSLFYGNDIHAILAQKGFSKELNTAVMQLYLTFGYAAGEDTLFCGIKKLMPGHTLVWNGKSCAAAAYWRPHFAPDESRTQEQWAAELGQTMQTIMADMAEETEKAQAAFFLSGGVDSSYLFALSDIERACSVGFAEPRYDESVLAQDTADRLGRKLTRLCLTPEQFFAAVPAGMRSLGQPLGTAASIAFGAGCRGAAETGARLCFSGEGSDEFFGGYGIYREAKEYAPPAGRFYLGKADLMSETQKQSLLKSYDPAVQPAAMVERLFSSRRTGDPLADMMAVDIGLWLEGNAFLNVEKMSAAAGVEMRMPMVDLRLFELAAKIPARFKVAGERDKIVLRAAAEKVLPRAAAQRPKSGFVTPIRYWLADSRYNAAVHEYFHGSAAKLFFDGAALDALLAEYTNGNLDLWRQVYELYAFFVWYEEFFAH